MARKIILMMKAHQELVAQAKEVIHKIIYLTLATCSNKGEPWNSPLYTAFDKNYNFYWASWIKNQHSQNIRENGKSVRSHLRFNRFGRHRVWCVFTGKGSA